MMVKKKLSDMDAEDMKIIHSTTTQNAARTSALGWDAMKKWTRTHPDIGPVMTFGEVNG
jgi:hypothetical protein